MATLLVQAFDANHQPLIVDDDAVTVVVEPSEYAVQAITRFMHDTRRGWLADTGKLRVIAYWKVGNPGTPGRVYLTRYGRSLPVAMSRIPRYTGPAPVMLPEPAAPYQKCKPGCVCNRHRTHSNARKESA